MRDGDDRDDEAKELDDVSDMLKFRIGLGVLVLIDFVIWIATGSELGSYVPGPSADYEVITARAPCSFSAASSASSAVFASANPSYPVHCTFAVCPLHTCLLSTAHLLAVNCTFACCEASNLSLVDASSVYTCCNLWSCESLFGAGIVPSTQEQHDPRVGAAGVDACLPGSFRFCQSIAYSLMAGNTVVLREECQF